MTVVDANGDTLVLDEGLVVPRASDEIDPAPGGDPNATRMLRGKVATGTWTFVVEDDRGRRAAQAVESPRSSWCIAIVLDDRIELFVSTGPTLLE